MHIIEDAQQQMGVDEACLAVNRAEQQFTISQQMVLHGGKPAEQCQAQQDQEPSLPERQRPALRNSLQTKVEAPTCAGSREQGGKDEGRNRNGYWKKGEMVAAPQSCC